MFEASVNRQFKSRFAALNGVVHMGPISVLRRIFNGHSIDGYVLSNNFEDQLVVMKKREFEALCKYIKVDIERTSSIPRAKLIKERGLRGIDLSNSGGINPAALIPYRDVTCGSYSNYLNGAYLNQIQPYTHMILRGMNFSHYEVISKAMQSNMANAINQAYEEYGGKINNVLSKRSYNAEEYEVALLAVAYVGIGELNPAYLSIVCANDGSGAKAMKNKLDKYRDKDKVEKVQSNVKEDIEKQVNLDWYTFFEKYSNNSHRYFKNIAVHRDGDVPVVEVEYFYYRTGILPNPKFKIYREESNNRYRLKIEGRSFFGTTVKYMPFTKKQLLYEEEVHSLECDLESFITSFAEILESPSKGIKKHREESTNNILPRQEQIELKNIKKLSEEMVLRDDKNNLKSYDLRNKYWYREMFKKYPNRFLSMYTIRSEGTGFIYIANDGLPYKLVIKDTVLTEDDLYIPDSIVMICYGSGARGEFKLRGWKREAYENLSMEEWDEKLFEFCELMVEGRNSYSESYMDEKEKESYYNLRNKSSVNLFDNVDSSDFSDFRQDSGFSVRTGRQRDYTNIDPFATSPKNSTEEDPMKELEELSKLFQY